MSERKFDMNRDGLGLLLFAVGLFPAVLIFKALLSSSPIESISGDGPIALTWIRTLGGIPSLLLTGGLMFLGGRLFLFGRRDGLLRNALGIAGVALSSLIILGAFSPAGGGRIGDATGGLVSSITHVLLGALFGVVALALAIWLTWLRKEREPRIALASESGVDAILGEDADTGVSAAEARALIPGDFEPDLEPNSDPEFDDGRMHGAPKPLRSAVPPSPYPEDVRLKGQIPAGARPLHRDPDVHSEPSSALQPSSVYHWTAPRTDHSGDGLDQDLAHVEEPAAVFGAEVESAGISETGPFVEEERWGAAVEIESGERDEVGVETEFDQPIARGAEALAAGHEVSASAEVTGLVEGNSATAAVELPRPSWEQPNLFREADEPPVDAYGTPLTLVEALRQARSQLANEPSDEPMPVLGGVEELPTETDFAPENEAGNEDDPEFEAVAPAPVRTQAIGLVEEDGEEELIDADADFEDGVVHEEDSAESEADDEDAEEDQDEHEIEGQLLDEGDDLEEDDEDEDAEDDDEAVAEEEQEELVFTARSIAEEDFELAPVDEEEALELEAVAETVSAIPAAGEKGPRSSNRVDVPPTEESPRAAAARESVPPSPADEPLVELMERSAASRIDRPALIVPAEPEPAQAKLAKPESAEAKLAAHKPAVEVKSAESNLALSVPPERKSVESKPAEHKSVDRKPVERKLAELRSAEVQPAEQPSKAERRQPVVQSPRPAAESGEREMILKPKAVTAAQAIKSQAALPERADLLREAGCLFVDRGRVAVSMLQRQYGMDFDQACLVLDELQNLGLIGPYLGGQRRDILLTREEWLEKVGSP